MSSTTAAPSQQQAAEHSQSQNAYSSTPAHLHYCATHAAAAHPSLWSTSLPEQERANQKQNDLCINFVQGKCIHAERCRYSHDVEAYLGSKPADLPGSCPFASQTPCPFGKANFIARGSLTRRSVIVLTQCSGLAVQLYLPGVSK